MRCRKLISLFLSGVLLLGGLPAPALAEAMGGDVQQDAEFVLLDSEESMSLDEQIDEPGLVDDVDSDDVTLVELDDGTDADDQQSADADDAQEAQADGDVQDEQSADDEDKTADSGDAATGVAEDEEVATDATEEASEEEAEPMADAEVAQSDASGTSRYGYREDPVVAHSIHDENEDPTLELLTSLPSYYSSVPKGLITSVKDQNPFGTCWTFATMAAIEASALKNGPNLGYTYHNMDLSERHLAYFTYYTATDPLGNTTGDYNYNTESDNYLNVGGNNTMALLTLTSWQGVVHENVASYRRLAEARDAYYSDSDFLEATKLNTNIAYGRDIYHVSGGYYIPTSNSDDVKRAIQRYGAVSASYYDSDYYFNSDTGAYYNNYNTSTNHAVTFVGWDDSYSKYNFRRTPSRNGAWLVKNSWGTGWGNNGYFWLSYEDTSIGQSAMAYRVENANRHQNIYQYDGSASPWYETVSSGSKVANVFRAKAGKQGERLEAVSFVLRDVNVKYSIQIYLDPTNSSKPTSGTPALATPIRGKTSYEGFYKINLDQPVPLIKGTKYAVVITLSKENGDNICFATDETYQSWGYVSNVKRKQGFVYEKGVGWRDLYSKYSNPANARIKAYTSNANLTGRTKIQNASISVPNKTYTGKRLYPKVTVSFGRVVLRKGTDYTVTYKSNLHAGTGKVIIKGKGRYSGSKTVTFKIKRKSLAKCKVSVVSKVRYTGTARKPSVTVKLGKATLKRNKHYTVKYVNNVRVGTATIKIVGKGDYRGTKKVTFKIVKKGGSTPSKKKNTLKVSTKAKTVSYATVKKKNVKVSAIVVKKAKGKVTYKKVSGSSVIGVYKHTGKIVIRKGTKPGTYKAKIRVHAAGNSSYKAASKTVTVTIKVKKTSTSSKRWEKEPNNYYDNATSLPLNTDMYGRTDFPDDDRFVFNAPSTGYYTIRITNDGNANDGSLRVWTYDSSYRSYNEDFSIELSTYSYVWRRFKLKKGRNYIWIWGSSCLNQYPYHIRVYR